MNSHWGWISCSLSNGMFPNEAGLSFKTIDGNDISLFCDIEFIDKENSLLRVKILEEKSSTTVIKLPVESLEGTKIVCVPSSVVSQKEIAVKV